MIGVLHPAFCFRARLPMFRILDPRKLGMMPQLVLDMLSVFAMLMLTGQVGCITICMHVLYSNRAKEKA